jgi:hypothetical protein
LEAAAARQDDERNRISVQKKGSFVMTLEETGEVIETLGNLTHTSSIDRDYFTLCFSGEWDTSHFRDFEGSDACLVVHDPEEVLERIHAELEKQYPAWMSIDGPVTYGARSELGVPFTKPELFVHQAEHRLVLLPPEPALLEPALITIGSIESVAEIVAWLPPTDSLRR